MNTNTLYRSESIQLLQAGSRLFFRSIQVWADKPVWTQWEQVDPADWNLDQFQKRTGGYVDVLARNARTL